jgi:hypothetical protein
MRVLFLELRKLHINFHRDFINLHYHPEGVSVSFTPTASPSFAVLCISGDSYSEWSEVKISMIF